MKKTFLNTNKAAVQVKTLSRADMKKIKGGASSSGCSVPRCFRCGCIDVEGTFYEGPCSAAYCFDTYYAEPWCIRIPGCK